MAEIILTATMLLQNDRLLQAERVRRLPLRLALLGLLNCCDKNGFFYWRPRHLKLKIFPYDDIDFEIVLDALAEHDFIDKHEENGALYGSIKPQTVLANWF